MMISLLIGVLAATSAVPSFGESRISKSGTVWTVTMIKVASGLDQTYLEYLRRPVKREEAQITAGFLKRYKVFDDR